LKGKEAPSETREAKEKNLEALELQRDGEKIYLKEFAERLDDVLKHEFKITGKDGREERIVLRDIIDKHLERFSSPEFSSLSAEERAERQREFVKDLGRGIYKIPAGDPWSFYFDRAIKTGRINCSCCAALLGIILENTKEKTGIQNIEYGSPYGHAINMITFGCRRKI